jgi:hypothetical protein
MTNSFDHLLREALKAPAAHPPGGCLDAETLAAWSEGSLDATRRAAVEAHASVCARCQDLLAAMIRSEPAIVSRPWWRSPALGWLAPLTVAAAAAVIWVRMDPRGTTESALAPSPVAPSMAAAPQIANDQARERQERTAEPKSLDAARPETWAKRREASGPPPVAVDRLRDEARARADNAPVTPSAKGAAPAATAPSEAEVTVTAPTATIQTTTATAAPAPATPAPPPTPAAPRPIAQVGPLPAPTAVAESANAGGLAARAAGFAAAASADQRKLVIQTADGSTRWWVTSPGTVQRSTDGGARWEVQATGTREILNAGAAPSSAVCWLVGRTGAVLLSTDGRSWRRVPFPEAIDLVSVSAVDGNSATVVAAGGRKFTTTDGGVNWR